MSADTINKRREAIARFSAAWNKGDVDTLLNLMVNDPVYKGSTGDGPGTVLRGRGEVRAAFTRMTQGNSDTAASGQPETPPEMYFFSDRALVYWNLMLPDAHGKLRQVDGVDIFVFSGDGRIAVKDAYRKAFS